VCSFYLNSAGFYGGLAFGDNSYSVHKKRQNGGQNVASAELWAAIMINKRSIDVNNKFHFF